MSRLEAALPFNFNAPFWKTGVFGFYHRIPLEKETSQAHDYLAIFWVLL
jgi:hypothetical protein